MDEILKKLGFWWDRFLLALPRIALAIVVLVVGILIANWITRIIRRQIKQKSHDPLMSGFLSKAIKLILMVVLVMLTLNVAGLSGIAGALLATAGASAVVLGFAFKDIAENFLAGIILAFNRPFRVDDTVQIEDVFGKIKEMEFRYTKITTFDGRNVYIPNSDVLTKPVFNLTEDGYFRAEFVVGIAYEDDIDSAKDVIRGCFSADKGIVNDDQHVCFVAEDELAASTVNLKVYFWVETEAFRRRMLTIRGNLMKRVKNRLTEAGFNLPADIRELKFYDASSPFPIQDSREKMATKPTGENTRKSPQKDDTDLRPQSGIQ